MPNSVVCVSEDGARPFYATTPVSVKLPERSDGADLVYVYDILRDDSTVNRKRKAKCHG